MSILTWIKGIAAGLGVGLIIGGVSGYKICTSGMWKAVVKDQAKQAVGVSKLQDRTLKDTVKLVKRIQYIRLSPDTTRCGPVRARQMDIDALGGVK